MRSFGSSGWLAGAVVFVAACGAEPETRPVEKDRPAAPGRETNSTDVDPTQTTDSERSTTPAKPAPPAPPSEWDTEKAWAEAHGVVIEPGKTTVIGKRRESLARSMKYEDTLVVFRSNGTIVRFVGTTKPAQMPNASSSVVPDVDKDGRKDLGIVRPGVYRAVGDTKFGLPGQERTAFKIVTEEGQGGLPAWRDLTGDGVFSPSERTSSEQRSYTISGIYIHYGFDPSGTTLGNGKYVGPWSVGCQNILYDELDAFVEAVGGAKASFRYAIVDD